MTAITFDTLKFSRRLKEAGIPEKQADTQAEVLSEVFASSMNETATKADIRALKTDVRALEGRFDALEGKLETRIGALESKIDSTRWILLILTIAVVAPQLKGLF